MFAEDGTGIDDVAMHTQWIDLARGLLFVNVTLGYKHDMSEAQVDRFSEICDGFAEDFRDLMGAQCETNYISNIRCGVFTDALTVWKNLYMVSYRHIFCYFIKFIF